MFQLSSTQRRLPSKIVENGRRQHPAIVGSASATLLHHRSLGQAARRLPAAGAEVAASVGAFEHLDVNRILSSSSPTAPITKVSENSCNTSYVSIMCRRLKLLQASVPIATAPPPRSHTKSQKAKDEMRLAHQSATEKRSEIDEDVGGPSWYLFLCCFPT